MTQTQPLDETYPSLVGQIEDAVKPGQPIALRLPPNLLPHYDTLAGRYFLVRCSSSVGVERNGDWSIFLRRPLFVCGRQPYDHYDCWQLYPQTGSTMPGLGADGAADDRLVEDAGFGWLARRVAGISSTCMDRAATVSTCRRIRTICCSWSTMQTTRPGSGSCTPVRANARQGREGVDSVADCQRRGSCISDSPPARTGRGAHSDRRGRMV